MPQVVIEEVELELVRKNIRTIRMTVYAPDGRVRLAAPLRTPMAAIQDFVAARRAWIQKHRQAMAAQEQPAALRFVDGETHHFRGQPYRLRVLPTTGPARVILGSDTYQIELHIAEGSTPEERAQALNGWYRQRLKELMPGLLAQWEPVVGRRAAAWGIKQMRTRWGTCNVRTHRIWLNLELIKRPQACLEYVLVHELTHLHERLHNARFWGLMDQFMPDWRQHKAELNRVLLTPAARPDAD